MATPQIKSPESDTTLDDEDVRRRVASGDLVPLREVGPALVDPDVMKRMRAAAARPLRGRSGGGV